ncbi:MAG: zinc ribbon domain-containing protein [Rhodocyclales bacterium]|nr:zinc ribbon domain-containing protein [Rhodocyclales bacterium]
MATGSKCQSCGMPLKADPKGGGTNADGSLSQEYCSYCYVNGVFVNPDMSMEEMKALVFEKLRERGFPKFVAGFFASGLGRLKRWKQAHESGQG